MPSPRAILAALRVAAIWLLTLAVLFGPAAVRGPGAFAATATTCGGSCPCDEAEDGAGHDEGHEEGHHDGHAEAHDDGHEEFHAGHEKGHDPCGDHDDDPCDDGCPDDCPDDCPNCRCCPGVAMALVPSSLVTGLVPCTPATVTLSPIEAPLVGIGSAVFRPPRRLS